MFGREKLTVHLRCFPGHIALKCANCEYLRIRLNRDQDKHAIESYRRSKKATESGVFAREIVPVTVKVKKAVVTVDKDEEISRTSEDSLPDQKPAFLRDGTGTVTAGNASPLSDGAAALVLMSEARAKKLGLAPLARVVSYADAEHAPPEFTTSPAKAIPIALERAQWKPEDVDIYEINEAFSVVALANMKLLDLSPGKVNVHGGAVSLGHPLGSSGARVIVTLVNALEERSGFKGVAAICNGGGGSSAISIERSA